MEKIVYPCRFQSNVSLKDRTWIHRGGKVDFWLQPSTKEELIAIGILLYKNHDPFVVIGHTSNSFFKNSYNIKCVLDTKALTHFSIVDENTLLCECGVSMAKISRYCVDNGIAGYEGMVSLPGTVGGAVFGNSGCYDCGIEKVLKQIDLLQENGEIVRLSKEELGFSFRSSTLKRRELSGIIINAYFDISNRQNKEILHTLAEKNIADRQKTQDAPVNNLGSTVNTFGYRKNVRNRIINNIVNLIKIVEKDNQKVYRVRKLLTCFLYGVWGIRKYISDKRIQCFIWKDEGADRALSRYLKMIENVYIKSSMEIEIFE